MHRPRHLWYLCLVPVLFVLVMSAAGCGGSAEEPLVRKFFQASRLGDNMTLANIATVAFDPNKDGRAESVSVVSVAPETSRELHFKDLEKARKEAAAAEDEFTKKKKEYQDKTIEAINRVLKAEAASQKPKGKDAEVQVAWTKWRADQADYAKKVSEARNKLNEERHVAELSIPDRDVTQFDGTEYTKEMTVSARVRMPNGQTANKTYVLTIQRVVLKDDKGAPINGRSLITGIREAGGAKS